jgi:RNA polymerase sigma-70 factor (ECF subfamily)
MPESPRDQEFLDQLRSGNEQAAQQLFQRYLQKLLELARSRISQRLARRIDPEDVVQSAFRTFFYRVKKGGLVIDHLDNLGKLLVSITLRKVLKQIAFHRAAKRNPSLEREAWSASGHLLLEVCASEPSPDDCVAFLDELEHFLRLLRPQDRSLLEMRLQGYGTEEIAKARGLSERHVRRVLAHIRSLAEQEELAGRQASS